MGLTVIKQTRWDVCWMCRFFERFNRLKTVVLANGSMFYTQSTWTRRNVNASPNQSRSYVEIQHGRGWFVSLASNVEWRSSHCQRWWRITRYRGSVGGHISGYLSWLSNAQRAIGNIPVIWRCQIQSGIDIICKIIKSRMACGFGRRLKGNLDEAPAPLEKLFQFLQPRAVTSIARIPYTLRGVFSLTSGVENWPELVGIYYFNLVSCCLKDGGKLSIANSGKPVSYKIVTFFWFSEVLKALKLCRDSEIAPTGRAGSRMPAVGFGVWTVIFVIKWWAVIEGVRAHCVFVDFVGLGWAEKMICAASLEWTLVFEVFCNLIGFCGRQGFLVKLNAFSKLAAAEWLQKRWVTPGGFLQRYRNGIRAKYGHRDALGINRLIQPTRISLGMRGKMPRLRGRGWFGRRFYLGRLSRWLFARLIVLCSAVKTNSHAPTLKFPRFPKFLGQSYAFQAGMNFRSAF